MPKLLLNCFLLLVPLLVWNIIFSSSLTQKGFHNDAVVPSWLLWSEHALRAVVFFVPLLFVLEVKDNWARVGLWVFGVGAVIYCASWLPLVYAPDSYWSRSWIGALSPAFTPILWLLGIALVGRSWLYAIGSVLFVAVHVLHNLISFEFIKW